MTSFQDASDKAMEAHSTSSSSFYHFILFFFRFKKKKLLLAKRNCIAFLINRNYHHGGESGSRLGWGATHQDCVFMLTVCYLGYS